jgi:Zn-dependent peptidase ImmA (M78 family)
MPGDRFRFSLAHELGHMVLHSIPEDDAVMESQAHRFAAEFLMPAVEIRPYLKNTNAKLSNFARVKSFWRVSIKALIMRAHDLKLITDYQYKSLNIQYNKTFQGGEPGDVAPEVPTRLGNIVRHHLEVLGYSVTDSRDSCASGRRTFRGSTSRARGFRSSSSSYLVCVPLCQPHGSRRAPTGASDQAAR